MRFCLIISLCLFISVIRSVISGPAFSVDLMSTDHRSCCAANYGVWSILTHVWCSRLTVSLDTHLTGSRRIRQAARSTDSRPLLSAPSRNSSCDLQRIGDDRSKNGEKRALKLNVTTLTSPRDHDVICFDAQQCFETRTCRRRNRLMSQSLFCSLSITTVRQCTATV